MSEIENPRPTGPAPSGDQTLTRRAVMGKGLKLAFAAPAILAMLHAGAAAAAAESAPSEPSEPSVPSQPSVPSAPSEPSQPSEPSAPSQPSASQPSDATPSEGSQPTGAKKTELEAELENGNVSAKARLVLYSSGDLFYKLNMKGASPTAAYIQGPNNTVITLTVESNGTIRGQTPVDPAVAEAMGNDPEAFSLVVQYDGGQMESALDD